MKDEGILRPELTSSLPHRVSELQFSLHRPLFHVLPSKNYMSLPPNFRGDGWGVDLPQNTLNIASMIEEQEFRRV